MGLQGSAQAHGCSHLKAELSVAILVHHTDQAVELVVRDVG